MKKKIAFLAPENKWWPYYIYKDIVEGLKEKYWKEIDVYFFNSKKDWLKLHFCKYDVVFSIIPFLFKPIRTKKYFYNLHWNFEVEKKRKWLWNKLLYLARWNLKFCDKIILTSYFLADKLNFKDKYKNKIEILPNFVEETNYIRPKKNFKKNDKIKLLTVSSTKFFEKWMGIVDLWKEVVKIKDRNIEWTIIAWWDQDNMKKIQKEFYKIKFSKNIKIKRLNWVKKDKLKEYYKKNDIFIYWTRLDTWWNTIMEAMSYWLPIILLKYDLWQYIYSYDFIDNNLNKKIKHILYNYNNYSKKSLDFIIPFYKRKILKKIFKIL